MDTALTRPHRLIPRFFAWWFGALAECLPGGLRRLFRPAAKYLIVAPVGGSVIATLNRGKRGRKIGSAELDGIDEAAQRKAVRKAVRGGAPNSNPIVLRLPGDRVLRRRLDLPWAAEPDLREALYFQIDRQTPFTPDEVYFDFEVVDRDAEAKRLTVEVTVIPRTIVDEAVARAERWGLTPDIVDVVDRDAGAAPRVNLLPGGAVASPGAGGSPVNLLLALIAAGLVAAAVYIPLDRRETAADALLARVMVAKVEAQATLRLREEVDALRKEQKFLGDQRRGAFSAVTLLDDLTRILPDDTWLFELKVTAREARIAGYAPTASSLIGLIDKSPMLRGPRFRSSVTQDPRTGLERFNMSFQIVPDGAAP